MDCCTIVAACLIAATAFAIGLCYLYGFTFQQLRQHPRFVHGVFIGSIVSLMVIFGYMYRLGHIPLFAPDESTAGSVGSGAMNQAASVKSGGNYPTSSVAAKDQGSPNATMDMTAGSGAGSMTLRTKTSFSDQNQYPVRSSEVVKRVCPPDPCPFGGGGGARDSKVKAMSAARGESPTSQEGEVGAPGAGGTAEGDMGSGGVPGGAGGVPSGGVPSGGAGGAEGAPPSGGMGASGPGEGASGAAQGEPIVVSPEETIEGGTEGIEGGDGFLPPFDVHAAAVVPCGTWIDDAENKEWAVQERMKKVVDIVDETIDMSLTAEELACLNRIRALDGKGPIQLGPGIVTRLEEALVPYFKEDTPQTVEEPAEEEPGPGYVSGVQDTLAPYFESASAMEEASSEEWPWWCLFLIPLLLLLAFIAWMIWMLGLAGFLAWLRDLLLAVLAFLATPLGLLALVACVLLILALLYYLCMEPSDEAEATGPTLTSAQPTPTQPLSNQPTGTGSQMQPTSTQPMTEGPGYYENACQYLGDTVGQIAEMGYGQKPKEYFKITYEEDISEEMWQKYKQRQQSFYVTEGSAVPAGVAPESGLPEPKEGSPVNSKEQNVQSQQQITGDVGSSPTSGQTSRKSIKQPSE